MIFPTLTTAVLVVVVTMVTTVQACTNPLSNEELQELYTNSDVVFRGNAVSGRSGLYVDRQGRTGRQTTTDYLKEVGYKNANDLGSKISVSFVGLIEGSYDCPWGIVTGFGGGYLVFASSETSRLRVGSCDEVPWSCVPETFRSFLQ
ncbi:hypothetical protein ElyMa_001448400 [Elysia marginata]|uniref:Uncharacterized protein n=1 Tax=Elysia marginata TaxID=1093978 RepID=A0AAV4J359_9GAST|nr:hypothetical protein ElyMa_001448400 [Elysia marginata]